MTQALLLGDVEGHICQVTTRADVDQQATCSCGEKWTYEPKATLQHMESIYDSHLRYFNKPRMETL